MCDFDNFPDDETPSRHKEARSHVDRTSRAKLWLARMKRGCAYLIVVDATLAIIVMKKHSQSINMIQYLSTRYSPYVKRLAKIKDLRGTATVAIIYFKLY